MMRIVFRFWEMGIWAGILICVVLAVRFLLRKYPKIYSCCLWALVGVRLLCPVRIESTFSLLPGLSLAGYEETEQKTVTGQDVSDAQYMLLPENTGREGTPVLPEQNKPMLSEQDKPVLSKEDKPVLSEQDKSETAGAQGVEQSGSAADIQKGTDGTSAGFMALLNGREASGADFLKMPAVFYIIVTLGFITFYTIQYLWMKHKLSTAVWEQDNIWLYTQGRQPFVMGIFAPKIYLPYSMSEERFFADSSFIDHIQDVSSDVYGSEEKRCILEHERTHIRHHDPLVRMAGILCICLHWWNPLVWLAVSKMNEDMEMFCDETVLRGASAEKRKQYANALLSFAVKESCFQAGLAFGESNTEKRIKNIRNKKEKNWLVSFMTAVLAVFCAAALMTVPKNAGNSPAKIQADSKIMVDVHTKDMENGQDGMSADVQTDSYAYAEYTGYMDECREWTGYTAFAGQDYDGDGQMDRVFRTYLERSDDCHYQIIFGNGDILDCDKNVPANGWPTIKAGDINGDGVNEMILSLQYETSTDMRAFGDLAVFEKKGNAYVRAQLPFGEGENGYTQEVQVHYQKKQEQLITVSLEGMDGEIDVPIDDWLWEEGQYKDLFAGTSTASVIWEAFLAEDGQETRLACKLHLFDKWSDYGLFLLLGCEEQLYVVKEAVLVQDEFSNSLSDTKVLAEGKTSYWLMGTSEEEQFQMYYQKNALLLKGKVKKSKFEDQLDDAQTTEIQDTFKTADACTITFTDAKETVTGAYKDWVRVSCEYKEGDSMSFHAVRLKIQDKKIVKIIFLSHDAPLQGDLDAQPPKNEDDVDAVMKIIKQQAAAGVRVSNDLDDEDIYTWTAAGSERRLTEINWGYMMYDGARLAGKISFSGLPKLAFLTCSSSGLTGIDISGCTELKYLNCSDNQLTALDVSRNPKLNTLYCSCNQIAELDVSKNALLDIFHCNENQISSLDVSNNTQLRELVCSRNEIAELDIKLNPKLEYFRCEGNHLEELDVTGGHRLEYLSCADNRLSSLDTAQNEALTRLECANNRLEGLDVSHNVKLYRLSCGNNPLGSLDVSGNAKLESLECQENRLDSLNVRHNLKLDMLDCSGNQLTTLDTSKNKHLMILDCSGNQLRTLDVDRNTVLYELDCSDNQLIQLNLGNYTDYMGEYGEEWIMHKLNCKKNQLDVLELSGIRMAEESALVCDSNVKIIGLAEPDDFRGQ